MRDVARRHLDYVNHVIVIGAGRTLTYMYKMPTVIIISKPEPSAPRMFKSDVSVMKTGAAIVKAPPQKPAKKHVQITSGSPMPIKAPRLRRNKKSLKFGERYLSSLI